MQIPFFWCDMNNFGDALNPIIMERLGNIKIKSVPLNNAVGIGIGSLGDMMLMDKHDTNYTKSPIFVFSTGIGFEEGGFFHNPDIILPERLKRNVKCYALRGKLTDARFEKMIGHKTGAVLGDGGLLVSKLIDKDKIEKKYELGIVPHFADKENLVFTEIVKNIPNSKILDPTVTVDAFLHDLCECKAVISTAMHPLIACDALRSPNLWVRISEKTTSRYKFHDYYSVYDLDKEPFDLLKNGFTKDDLQKLIDNYDVADEKVYKIQNDLMIAFEKFVADLNKLKYKLLFVKCLKKVLKPFTIFVPIKKYRKQFRQYLKNN